MGLRGPQPSRPPWLLPWRPRMWTWAPATQANPTIAWAVAEYSETYMPHESSIALEATIPTYGTACMHVPQPPCPYASLCSYGRVHDTPAACAARKAFSATSRATWHQNGSACAASTKHNDKGVDSRLRRLHDGRSNYTNYTRA